MGELQSVLDLIKTPLGIVGITSAAVFLLSRSNAKLSGVLIKEVPKLGERVDEHGKMLHANTRAQESTRQEIIGLRNQMAATQEDVKSLRVSLGHTDERLNNLASRDNEGRLRQEKLIELIARLIRRINGEDPPPSAPTPLSPSPVGGGVATKLKKTGNDPGGTQGR